MRDDTTLHTKPDFVAIPSVLFNTGSSQCLTSRGNARSPELADCDESASQQWKWEPRAAYAGNQHNAALVSVSTGQCVAEHDGRLAEEPCEEWNVSQRWTPWDFGLIFTPSRRCLGAENNRLHIRGCASMTTRYRWSTMRPSWSTDLRLTGAMYGDVTGDGTLSAVYVQRRSDGPGFDVYVQTSILGKPEEPENWYANAVRFDSRATMPTCGADTLCFDSARFLTGDFDGDGRADLMVVTPRNGGSAFWLLHSNGNHFSAPVLWFQSDKSLPAERVQQYLAFSTKETSHEKILVAVQRSDKAVDLWTISADQAGQIQQTKVNGTNYLKSNVQLLTVGSTRKDTATFIAIQSADDYRRLAVTALSVEKERLSFGATSLLPSQFQRDTTRFTRDASADATIVMTVPHFQEPGGVDVWKWNVQHRETAPVLLAYLRDLRWQDAAPALLRDNNRTALVFYERTDAVLANTLFSAGTAALARYAFDGNNLQSIPMEGFPLPAVYSETLWLDRLAQ
ncbi:RICIN domain-containing protein [Paraburkholderia hospita]|uniref:RICIN domain-containing protein n=2 Tax=Paraburkholderia hospita TaxID=169430 RepID=UPI001F1F2606|nr:RICIN domain-containing protein [Paraburkholderia hospita]